ncbi:MAG: amino acid adenylation domain-containing protein, partial [Lachnospiraceae bacterium]|nr:amino acid adenylation domain-containing protein [Lachnospiraceae bacterium]
MINLAEKYNDISYVKYAPCFFDEEGRNFVCTHCIDGKLSAKIREFSENNSISEKILIQWFWNMAVVRMTSETEIIFGIDSGKGNVIPLIYRYEGGNVREQIQQYGNIFSKCSNSEVSYTADIPWDKMSYSFGKSKCGVEIEIYCGTEYELIINCINGKYPETALKKTAELMCVLLSGFTADENISADGLRNLTPEEESALSERIASMMDGYEYENVNIIDVFRKYVRSTPDKNALIFYSKKITYKELDILSDKLAQQLVSNGIKKGAHIAVDITVSPETIIAMLAAVKSGGCYIPLDVTLPKQRIMSILSDVQADIIILNKKSVLSTDIMTMTVDIEELKKAEMPSEFVIAERNDETPLYIMFTSGTTSKPKGIVVPDKGAISLAKSNDCYRLEDLSYLFQSATMAFDAAVFEIWGALLNGVTIVIVDKKLLMSPGAIEKFAMLYRNNAFFMTTSLFNNFVDMEYEVFRYINVLIVGGEKFSAAHGEKFLKMFPDTILINGYGPTENSVFSTYCILNGRKLNKNQVPIGSALRYRGVMVCDSAYSPLPYGAVGEIVVYGAGVAQGYYNDPELTESHFYRLESGVKAYKTGDYGFIDDNGETGFISRKDFQLKIRGNRINISEIEQALLELENVVNAAVLPKYISQNNIKLSGYIVEKTDTVFNDDIKKQISQQLRNKLPECMIPSEYYKVPRIPVSVNGKMDTAKLKEYADIQEKSISQLSDSDVRTIDYINGIEDGVPFHTYASLVSESIEKFGGRTAVYAQDRNYTYDEFFSMARSTAEYISGLVPPMSRIVLLTGKGFRQLLVSVSIVLAGMVYAPLDYDMPYETALKCIKKMNAEIVLADDVWCEKLKSTEGLRVINISSIYTSKESRFDFVQADENYPFCIIHTSGSTGFPKGVEIKYKGIINCLQYTNKIFNANENDCVLALTNHCHDMSLYDIFGMFICGGAVAVIENYHWRDPYVWNERIMSCGVTIWNSVPVFMEIFLDVLADESYKAIKQLKVIIHGGDYFKAEEAGKLIDINPGCALFNSGGPSETTLWNIYHRITRKDVESGLIPYGRPFPSTKYYILDDELRLVPVGVKGTMYVSGVGVADGYIGGEENGRFIEWKDGIRLYNTGDTGCYSENGYIIFGGRNDNQIKRGGKRIELDGIKSVALNTEGISDAVVIFDSSQDRICLFYTSHSKDEISLNSSLKEYLPEHMMPNVIIRLDNI